MRPTGLQRPVAGSPELRVMNDENGTGPTAGAAALGVREQSVPVGSVQAVAVGGAAV